MNTTRVLIHCDEYESNWEWILIIPEPQYAEQTFKANQHTGDIYDIPTELAEKYQKAIRLRDEVDSELSRIKRTRENQIRDEPHT
jgi:hypothetical protein